MGSGCLDSIEGSLISCGYRRERIRARVPLSGASGRVADLVAYADQPFDARTATIAAVDSSTFAEQELGLLRPVGASVIVHCFGDHAKFWKQAPEGTEFLRRVQEGKIASFFQEHLDQLGPEPIYRAKVWGRTAREWQLDFVDIGLLPAVEQSAGEDLKRLLERVVTTTKESLGWQGEIAESDGRWLLQSVFWLLAAKILRDKEVPGFKRLNLCDLESVYLALAKHYDKHHPRPVQIDGSRRRDGLSVAAEIIQGFGHCGAVTTESLAWVYESALIDKETRQKLGTHSTPTWLVDEVVAKLRPWIEEMPVDDRHVFEPACGHAGFLISAMRLLSELLPDERSGERKSYLRKRLRGIELDPFAYEVARLSLTLADVPNDNGWMLENADMFADGILRKAVGKATIVLANPPFEKFGGSRPQGAMYSRADETFRQIVDGLPIGGVFGVVMPQGILHSKQGAPIRRRLLDDYEISEITLFADKVFNYGEPETAMILGRRVVGSERSKTTSYRRVREDQIAAYRKTLVPSSIEKVPVQEFEQLGGNLFIPELNDVWSLLRGHPKLGDFVDGGKGFEHKGKNDPTLPVGAILESDVEMEGLHRGFAGWSRNQLTHELPKPKWLNLDREVIGAKRHGTRIGEKQILLNYARVSRGTWRIKALIDASGHPVTSRFLVFRPTTSRINLKVLWAICNSPLANAYLYSHSSKRDVLGGTVLKMPVLPFEDETLRHLEASVDAYFEAAKGAAPIKRTLKRPEVAKSDQLSLSLPNDWDQPESESLKYLHWRIDAEVLRLYDLPSDVEKKILQLFTGITRLGVPFIQTEYFPAGFESLDRLDDLLAITADWATTNRRRVRLIKKDVKEGLSAKESKELSRLEKLADARIDLIDLQHPAPPDEIQRTVERLKREGKWQG